MLNKVRSATVTRGPSLEGGGKVWRKSASEAECLAFLMRAEGRDKFGGHSHVGYRIGEFKRLAHLHLPERYQKLRRV